MLTGDQFTGLPESSGSNEMIFAADDAPLTVLSFSSDIESRRRWILSPDCFVKSRSGVELLSPLPCNNLSGGHFVFEPSFCIEGADHLDPQRKFQQQRTRLANI